MNSVEITSLNLDSPTIVDFAKRDSYGDLISVITPSSSETYLAQIAIMDDFDDAGPGSFAYITYHHGGDPSGAAVVAELYRYMNTYYHPNWEMYPPQRK